LARGAFIPPFLALSKEGWRGFGVMGQPLNAPFIWICRRGWKRERDLGSRHDSHVEKPGRNLTHRGQGAERRWGHRGHCSGPKIERERDRGR